MSRDGTIGFATVNFDERADALPKAAVEKVITTAESTRSATLDVQLGGQAIDQAQQASLGFATVVGIAAAILILLISFGSFSAMGLPIATALLGLGAGIGVINLASHVIDMPSFATELALMIGLGVGVDYALFIVTRFRENYRTNGGHVEQAVEAAINTSGRAVLFAGATVVIALLGMFALGVSLLNGAAVAASIGVVLVMAASLTLLPAFLSLMGPRIGRVGRRRAARETDGTRPTFWLRWVQRVQRRPAVTAIAATALMLALAAPALGLRLASSDAGNDPAGQTTRQAFDLLAEGFGPGFNGPLQMAVSLPRAHDSATLTELTHTLSSTAGIASVAPPRLNATGTTAAFVAYPTTSPQSAQTSSLVARLRDGMIPPIERRTGARVYVGGATAAQVDFSRVLSSKLPVLIGVVIAVAALLLLLVFRSLVIPAQAAVMNLLSIGASLGIIQAVFERGWFGGLFGAQVGPIDAFIPVLAFAIVFGLSMDTRSSWSRACTRNGRPGVSERGRQGGPCPHRPGDHRRGRGHGRRVRRICDQRRPCACDVRADDGERRVPGRGCGPDAACARSPPAPRQDHLGAAAVARPAAPRVAIEAEPAPKPRPVLEPAFEAGS